MSKRPAPSSIRTPSKTVSKSTSAKRTRRAPFFPIGRNPTGFPPKMTMRHKYAGNPTTALGQLGVAGGVYTHVLSANGMYDPDITATGHQPLYFDQMRDIYDHYTVMKSTCKVWFASMDSGVPNHISLGLDDDSAASATLTTLQEQPETTSSLLLSVGGKGNAVLTKSYIAKRTFGGSPLSDANLQGTASANPPEQEYYYITASPWTVPTAGVYFRFEITYEVIWEEVRTMTGS